MEKFFAQVKVTLEVLSESSALDDMGTSCSRKTICLIMVSIRL